MSGDGFDEIMGGPRYYDRQGQPMTWLEWAHTFEDFRYRLVARTTVKRPGKRVEKWISTVWVGLDHRWSPPGPPLIFETMLFTRDRSCMPALRTSTEAEAMAAHWAMVQYYRDNRRERRRRMFSMLEDIERRSLVCELTRGRT